MDILTAIFGSKEAKAEAKAADKERQEAAADAKAQRLAARQARIDARLAARQERVATRQANKTKRQASGTSLTEALDPVDAIAALGKALTPSSKNVKLRQDAKTTRTQIKADARTNAAMARAATNIARAKAGDTTSPGQDIVAQALGTFQEQSDQVMGLAAQYLGGKALDSGLSAAEMLATAPGVTFTAGGSASTSVSNGGLVLLGLLAVGVAVAASD